MEAENVARNPVAHALSELDDALAILEPLQTQHPHLDRGIDKLMNARRLLDRAVATATTPLRRDSPVP